MKTFFGIFFICFTLFCTAQTWQSAYDSCVKYQGMQQFRKSLEWGDKALEIYEEQVITKDTNYSNILNRQFENCYYGGLYKKGEVYAKKDSIWAKQNKNEIRYAISCVNLAGLYYVQRKYDETEVLLKEAKMVYMRTLDTRHASYVNICNNLGGVPATR